MKFTLSKLLSWMVEAAVIGLVAMALAANFLIIVQGIFSPLNVVHGNSMSPSIKDHDAVLALPAAPEEIRQGDVVIFPDPEEEGYSIVHRVVSLEARDGRLYAVTMGDANPFPDPQPVPVNRITGKVRLVIPMGGAFLEFLRSPQGFLACVLLPFAVLLLFLLARGYREKVGEGGSFLLLPIVKP